MESEKGGVAPWRKPRGPGPAQKDESPHPAQLHFQLLPKSPPSFPGHPLPGADGRAPLGRLLRRRVDEGCDNFVLLKASQDGQGGLRPWRWIIPATPGCTIPVCGPIPWVGCGCSGPKATAGTTGAAACSSPAATGPESPFVGWTPPRRIADGILLKPLVTGEGRWLLPSPNGAARQSPTTPRIGPTPGCTHRSIRARLHLSGQGGRAQPPVRRAHAHRAARPAVDAGAPL